jgi:DNA (cytosine-5)-methyltransferase 1
MARQKPTFVSLFSGCGGFDLGFIGAGYRCLGAYDIDAEAVAVYRENLPGKAKVTDLSDRSNWPTNSTPDVVLAGPPCQGFSTAGRRQLNDPRNSLLVTAAEIAVTLKPRAIVIENVAGVVAGSHRKYWDRMLALLRAAGFRAVEICCEATQMGMSQKRKRMVAIAWRTTFEGEVTLPQIRGGTLRDAIGSINGAPNHNRKLMESKSDAAIIATHIRPGQKLSNVRASERAIHTWEIPTVFGRTTQWERSVLSALLRRRRQKRLRDFGDADPVSAQALRACVGKPVAPTLQRLIEKGYLRRIGSSYDLVHTFNGKFRRLAWDNPSPTVDTKFGDPYYFLHPDENRAYTVREAARLQGFPDTFVFGGLLPSQFRMIGNAVPPPVARLIAQHLLSRVL